MSLHVPRAPLITAVVCLLGCSKVPTGHPVPPPNLLARGTLAAFTAKTIGGYGNDTLQASGPNAVVVPGPGRDTVTVGGSGARVEVYDACELVPGERLTAVGTGHVLVLPVALEEAKTLGVTVGGFAEVRVDRGLAHQSLCHCFHGRRLTLDGRGVTCSCDAGWTGARCDACADPDRCVPAAKRAATQARVLADASAPVREAAGAQLRAAEWSEAMLRADSVVIASVGGVREVRRATMTPTYLETFTEADLVVHEVLRGAIVSRALLSFIGRADPAHENHASESPDVLGGGRRLYALQLTAEGTYLAHGAADWRVAPDGSIDLGFFTLTGGAVREALR